MDKYKGVILVYSRYVVIVIVLVLVISLVRSVIRVNQAGQRVSEKQEQLEKLKNENERLSGELEKVRDDLYTEEVLRNSLGYAKEGEIVLVLPDDEILRSFVPDRKEEFEEEPKQNWEKWLELFI